MPRDFDFEDDEYDECEMRRRGEPICTSCGSLSARVVRGGECESCADLTDDNRCEAEYERLS